MATLAPQNWYPDPTRRHELRYWDGYRWTSHVVTQQVQSVDPFYVLPPSGNQTAARVASSTPLSQSPVFRIGERRNRKVARQVRKARAVGTGLRGNGSILSESVLVINQKPRRFERRPEYTIYDRGGRVLGTVREIGYNFLLHEFTIHSEGSRRRTLELVDRVGNLIYRLDRPAKMMKPRVMLLSPDGEVLGEYSKSGLFSRGIDLTAGGDSIGRLVLKDFRTFRAEIHDNSGARIASISRTWAGRRVEKNTKADNYVVEITRSGLAPVVHALVTMSAVVIDILYEQNEPTRASARLERRARRLRSEW